MRTGFGDKRIIEGYNLIKEEIKKRCMEFENMLSRSDEDIFAELVFCLLTPQSKAKLCWNAVLRLRSKGLLIKGGAKRIEKELKGVRFHRNKAKFIVEARKVFVKEGKLKIKEEILRWNSPIELREWLVRNVKGMGYKESSHFLRNIGLGENLAILDRHILTVMKEMGVISNIPRNLTRKKYHEIEAKFINFACHLNIPPPHLDLYMWYLRTGEVFK